MNRFVTVLLTVFSVSFAAHAQETSKAPDLMGTWVSAAGEVGHWSGALDRMDPGAASLEVREQLGGVFHGTITYRNAKTGPEFEGEDGLAHDQVEAVLGIIDWDGETIVWVDKNDETIHRARLINDRVMEVIAYEAGAHPVVNRMILVRQ